MGRACRREREGAARRGAEVVGPPAGRAAEQPRLAGQASTRPGAAPTPKERSVLTPAHAALSAPAARIAAITLVHMLLLGTILVAMLSQANPANLSPFLYGGADNMFAAASLLYFAFAGFDVLATSAEEVGGRAGGRRAGGRVEGEEGGRQGEQCSRAGGDGTCTPAGAQICLGACVACVPPGCRWRG